MELIKRQSKDELFYVRQLRAEIKHTLLTLTLWLSHWSESHPEYFQDWPQTLPWMFPVDDHIHVLLLSGKNRKGNLYVGQEVLCTVHWTHVCMYAETNLCIAPEEWVSNSTLQFCVIQSTSDLWLENAKQNKRYHAHGSSNTLAWCREVRGRELTSTLT